jgi:prephenate dehydratase
LDERIAFAFAGAIFDRRGNRMKVAFQGELGAYGEDAVLACFEGAESLPCDSFEEVFGAAASGKVDFGAVPIENSIAGSVHENYDLLHRYELHIRGEYLLRIRHCLIALPGVRIKDIKKVISHPQALAQCGGYLRRQNIQPVEAYNTAGSVKLLKESGAREMGAIASRRAAELYGMQVLEENIADHAENRTRFLFLGREPALPMGEAKTSIVFTLKDRPDALSRALAVFARYEIALTKVEARPLPGKPWGQILFLDFPGLPKDEMLDEVGKYTSNLRVLGSYPRFWDNLDLDKTENVF